jgi:hypothetical protein
MEGSRITKPIIDLGRDVAPRACGSRSVLALIGVLGVAVVLAVPANAADITTKRPAAASRHTVSIPAKPLIPPAPPAAKLSPPPAARSALPLETELQPVAPDPQAPATGEASPRAAKSPTS